MFIAHLPAGYLCARGLASRAGGSITPAMALAGMAGGVFPDSDLFYRAFFASQRIHHHRYPTHLPLVWLAITVGVALLLRTGHPLRRHAAIFLLAVWSHLLLDSVAGDIWWRWPWFELPFPLVRIPAVHSRWWLNYLLHWTAVVEFGLVGVAAYLEWSRPVFFGRWRRPAA